MGVINIIAKVIYEMTATAQLPPIRHTREVFTRDVSPVVLGRLFLTLGIPTRYCLAVLPFHLFM